MDVQSEFTAFRTIGGPCGHFEIAAMGACLGPHEYIYKDAIDQQTFFVEWLWPTEVDQNSYSLLVHPSYSPNASVIFSEDESRDERIIQNLEHFFKTRQTVPPFELLRDIDAPTSVTFISTWVKGKTTISVFSNT